MCFKEPNVNALTSYKYIIFASSSSIQIFIQNIFHKIKNVAPIGDEKKNQTLDNIVDGDECMKAALLEHFSQTCLV